MEKQRTLINRWLSPLQAVGGTGKLTLNLEKTRDLVFFSIEMLKPVINKEGITVIIPPGVTPDVTSTLLRILSFKIDAARTQFK